MAVSFLVCVLVIASADEHLRCILGASFNRCKENVCLVDPDLLL